MIKTACARRFLLRPYLLYMLLFPAGLLILGLPMIVVGQDGQADQVKSSAALDSPALPDTQENRIAASERYLSRS